MLPQLANEHTLGLSDAVPKKMLTTPVLRGENALATEVWAVCEPATPEHEYIMRKQGVGDGLRVYPYGAPPLNIRNQNVAGWLVVPCRDLDGNLQTLQFIPCNGGKLNLPGASFGQGCFVVGNIAESNCLYVVEGIGQAWATRKATKCAAIVCFGAGRMATVSAVLRV